jgi:hypothetical protein
LTYPIDALELIGVSPGDSTRDWIVLDGVAVEEGTVVVGGFHSESFSSDERVVLAEVSFLVKDGMEGELFLEMKKSGDDLEGMALAEGSIGICAIPEEYVLEQNYPNPFNPVTSIEYALPEAAQVRVEVYNMLGQVVDVLVEGDQEAGYHKVTWDASNVASGVYFYRIAAGGTSRDSRGKFTATKRMVLMK